MQQGEQIIIANRGEPVALLSRYQESPPSKRLPGRLRGQFTVSDDFNQPYEDVIRLFEGEEDRGYC